MAPSVSEKQRKFMGAELARFRSGKKTRTGMNAKQLKDFASSFKAEDKTPAKKSTPMKKEKGFTTHMNPTAVSHGATRVIRTTGGY